MYQLIYAAKEACLAATVLIPVLLVLNHFRFRSPKATILYTLFCMYLAGVYALVGLPNAAYIRFDPTFQLIPFADFLEGLRSTVLNVVLFLPMGVFLPLLWKKYRRFPAAVFTGFCLSLAIELLQIFTLRAVDVNDLITNTLGTAAGFLLAKGIARLFPSLKLRQPGRDLPLLVGCTTAVMFFLEPVIWKLL